MGVNSVLRMMRAVLGSLLHSSAWFLWRGWCVFTACMPLVEIYGKVKKLNEVNKQRREKAEKYYFLICCVFTKDKRWKV